VPGLSEAARDAIWGLFEAHVDAGLSWLAGNAASGREFIPMVANNRTTSLALLMQSLLSPARGFKRDAKPEEVTMLHGSTIWGWVEQLCVTCSTSAS
jgi:dynein heavy chain, axonemal